MQATFVTADDASGKLVGLLTALADVEINVMAVATANPATNWNFIDTPATVCACLVGTQTV